MRRSHAEILGVACLLCIASPQVSGQARQELVDGPRPVADAVSRLAEDCRCVITYEDPRWQKTDVEDVTDRVSRVKAPPRRTFGPKGGSFVFPYERPASLTGPRDMSAAVTTMLDWYKQTGAQSQFRVESAEDGVHVFPAQGSILDVRISLPELEGRTSDVLNEFLAELSKAAGQKVTLGSAPMGHLKSTKARVGSRNEPARRVLARLLSSAGRKVYWRLFNDYTLQFYALNLTLADPGRCADKSGPCDPGDTATSVWFETGPQ